MASCYFKFLRRFVSNSGDLLIDKCLLNARMCHLMSSNFYSSKSPINLNENENPFKKTFRIFADDFKDMKNVMLGRAKVLKSPKFPTHCDVIIIGGGVMGFSIAYWLQQRALEGLKIIVVEKDPSVKSGNFSNLEVV